MDFDNLKQKISALMSEYNKGLDDDSDDRVTLAQLHTARPGETRTNEAPGVAFVAPPEMVVAGSETATEPKSLSAAAAGGSFDPVCCRKGQMGIMVGGNFVSCWKTSTSCQNFSGPDRCDPL